MFEYFFIIGTIFLILSGALDEFRINKAISVGVLLLMFILSILSDVNIKYTVFFSWVSLFVVISSIAMFVILPKEHFSSLLYSTVLGFLVWAIVTLAPASNTWYFKSIMFGFFAAMLGQTYFQGSVISVFACLICNLFAGLIGVDFELFSMALFVGEGKTELIVSMLLPIMIMVFAEKRTKEIALENAHGAS